MARVLIAAVLAVPCAILLLPAYVVAGVLALFATGVRALSRRLEPRFVPWTELMVFDPMLGWRPQADVDACYLVDRDDVFRLVTDQDGWPGIRSVDESAVVVIGDSFAFGYGAHTGRSFADLIPGTTIKGVGAPGYSMVQSVLLMEQFGERLAGKLVVWFVCLENDLEDNMTPAMGRYRSPFVRLSRTRGEWEIAQEHIGPAPWRTAEFGTTRLLPHLCVPGAIADRVYAGCDYLIGRATATCKQFGSQLVVVTIPDPTQLTRDGLAKLATLSGNPDSFDGNLPDRRIAASCEQRGIPLIVGKDHLTARDYKRREGLHWNARGHRRVAEVIGRVYESFRSGKLHGFAGPPYPSVAAGRTSLAKAPPTRDEPPVSIGAL